MIIKRKIIIFFISFLFLNTCLSSTFVYSCSMNNNANQEEQNLNDFYKNQFELAFKSFNLKNKVDISQILSSAITNETDLLKYFEYDAKEDIKYTFISANADLNDLTKLIVVYKISSTKNPSLFKNKVVLLTGFKNVFSEFNIAFEQFNLYKRDNKIDLSKIKSSSITNENDLLKYFEYDEYSDVLYEFVSSKVSPESISKLIVTYKLTSTIDTRIFRNKIIILDGFNNPEAVKPNIEEEKRKNQIILDKIINLLRIDEVKSHSEISARDFLRDHNNFEKYFKVNREEIWDLNLGNDIQIPGFTLGKRDPNNLQNIIFTLSISVGKNDTIALGKKEIIIGGFKSLISDLDSSPSPSIILPTNAISYKGKIEPVIFEKIGENSYKDRINNKFTFEQLKVELIYQLRFWMYQMFSDNFSEIDYWIEEENTPNQSLIAKIEGIVKNDVDDLSYWSQQLGTIQSAKDNLKKGQKIKIQIKVLELKDWRPKGNGVFGFLDGIHGFSFAKGCENINFSINGDKGAYATTLPTSSFEVSIDNVPKISVNKWVNFTSVMFTVGATRPKV